MTMVEFVAASLGVGFVLFWVCDAVSAIVTGFFEIADSVL